MLIVLLPFILIQFVSLYFLFEKAGEKGWKALIPFYNTFVMVKISGRPTWWFYVILFVPVIGLLFQIGLAIDFIKSFGQNKARHILYLMVFGTIYMPYLAFSKNIKYVGPAAQLPKEERSSVTEWGEAILFAVVAATLIRWIFMEAFVIPTPSMENSLLMGDYLFVSKFHYGARTPKTPLQVPLTHRNIWLTDLPSYTEAIQLPQFRLPGFSSVKNNDVVVFNWPADSDYPTDLKTNYIKRCQAIGGDTLQVINKQVYINGKPAYNPTEMEFNYKIYTQDEFPKRVFRKYKIPNFRDNNGDFVKYFNEVDSGKLGYVIDLSKSKLERMTNDKVADSIKIINFATDVPEMQLFPYNKKSRSWDIDNYGPIWVPKAGATIKLDSNNVSTYLTTIQNYEGWETVEAKGDRLIIDGNEVKEYTFRQDYYFMMGDNRHNSSDSRFWGFVPADHIVGKAFMIWLSTDSEGGWSDKIRWNRLFTIIK